jgi:hypothetical protein
MSEYVLYNGQLFTEDELYHHGIKGMKWGVRRSQEQLDRLAGRIKKQEGELNEIERRKGVASSSYSKKARNLYLTKTKYNLEKAKQSNNTDKIRSVKADVKQAKIWKKKGMANSSTSELRKVYGNKVTKQNVGEIKVNEYTTAERTRKGKKAAGITIGTIGAVGVGALALHGLGNALINGVEWVGNAISEIAAEAW